MLKKILFLVMLLSMQTLFADLSFEQELDNVSFNEAAKEASISASKQGKKSFKFTGTYIETGRSFLEVEYKNGKRDGAAVFYYKNGNTMAKGNYKDDKKDRVWEFYTEDGKLERKVTYRNGLYDGMTTEFFKSGKINRTSNYVQGIKNGKEKEYYVSGRVQNEGNYINNQLEGKYIIYYPNGRIYMKSNFINNKHNGEIVYYYENQSNLNQYRQYDKAKPLDTVSGLTLTFYGLYFIHHHTSVLCKIINDFQYRILF